MRIPLLSIIIPIYNAELYINRCLDSIICGKHEVSSYEILCVDNGSTDRSCELIKNYCNQFNYVRLVTSKKGVSNARNKGLEESTGEFIMFLDADDYWVNNSVSSLLKLMKLNDLDILHFDKIRTSKDNLVINPNYISLKTYSISDFYKKNDNPSPFCWTYIYKKAIIGETRFNTELTVCEDFVFVEEILLKCTIIGHVKNIFYAYYYNPTSIMNNTGDIESRICFINSYYEAIMNVGGIFSDYNGEISANLLKFRLEYRCYWFFKRAKDKRIPFKLIWQYKNNLPFNKFLFLGKSHLKCKSFRIRRIFFNNFILFYLAYKINNRKII